MCTFQGHNFSRGIFPPKNQLVVRRDFQQMDTSQKGKAFREHKPRRCYFACEPLLPYHRNKKRKLLARDLIEPFPKRKASFEEGPFCNTTRTAKYFYKV